MAPLIARATIHHFRHTLETPTVTVLGPRPHRPALLIRLEDAEGAHGWGEIWCNFPPDGDLHRARLAARVLPHALNGMSGETERPFAEIMTRLHRLVIQAGEPGPVAQIACGADIALHDLRARRAGLPLCALLGGASTGVPAYASGISPDEAGEQVTRMRALGYRNFKQRVGFGPDDGLGIARDTAAGLEHDERLMLDANQAWDLSTARRQTDRLADLNLRWMEEPMAADTRLTDWQTLADTAPMPLAAGENLTGDSFGAAIDQGALGVIQPDVCKWGGLSETRIIAQRALAAGRVYCPHFLGGGVGLIASAHLLAAVGGDGLLEVDASENPLLSVFSGRGLTLEDGLFPLGDRPGIGYDPDVALMADLSVSCTEVTI